MLAVQYHCTPMDIDEWPSGEINLALNISDLEATIKPAK